MEFSAAEQVIVIDGLGANSWDETELNVDGWDEYLKSFTKEKAYPEVQNIVW